MIRAFTLTAISLALALSVAHAQSRDTENSADTPTLNDGDRGVEAPVPAGNILKDGDRGVEAPVGGVEPVDDDAVPGVGDETDTERLQPTNN